MQRSAAYKKLGAIFNKQIKNIFKLPSKGRIEPLEAMFEKYHPEHMIINNYIRNFNKWFEVEYENIEKRCREEKNTEELDFYRRQFNEATILCNKKENDRIDEKEYQQSIEMRINGKTNWNIMD